MPVPVGAKEICEPLYVPGPESRVQDCRLPSGSLQLAGQWIGVSAHWERVESLPALATGGLFRMIVILTVSRTTPPQSSLAWKQKVYKPAAVGVKQS